MQKKMELNEKEIFGKKTHENETWGIKSKFPIFNKINDIIGLYPKIIRLSNAINNNEKSQKKDHLI
jgi:hypothetical protein